MEIVLRPLQAGLSELADNQLSVTKAPAHFPPYSAYAHVHWTIQMAKIQSREQQQFQQPDPAFAHVQIERTGLI